MRYFGNGARTCPRGSIISPTYRSPGVQPFAVGRTTEFFRTGNLWAFRAEVIWDPHICLVETFVFFVPQPNPLRWSGQCQLCLALAAIGVCESESAQRGPIAGRAAIRGDAFEVLVGARRIAPGNNEGRGFRFDAPGSENAVLASHCFAGWFRSVTWKIRPGRTRTHPAR